MSSLLRFCVFETRNQCKNINCCFLKLLRMQIFVGFLSLSLVYFHFCHLRQTGNELVTWRACIWPRCSENTPKGFHIEVVQRGTSPGYYTDSLLSAPLKKPSVGCSAEVVWRNYFLNHKFKSLFTPLFQILMHFLMSYFAYMQGDTVFTVFTGTISYFELCESILNENHLSFLNDILPDTVWLMLTHWLSWCSCLLNQSSDLVEVEWSCRWSLLLSVVTSVNEYHWTLHGWRRSACLLLNFSHLL